MKSRLIVAGGALLAALFCLPALAQSAPPPAGMMPEHMHHQHGPRDCSKAPNPTACGAFQEAHGKAAEACKNVPGPQYQGCMHEQMMQNFDCSKAPDAQRCAARKAAFEECKGQPGPAFHQCMHAKMPPVDCSKTRHPQRCEKRQQTR